MTGGKLSTLSGQPSAISQFDWDAGWERRLGSFCRSDRRLTQGGLGSIVQNSEGREEARARSRTWAVGSDLSRGGCRAADFIVAGEGKRAGREKGMFEV